ncbi:serine/threonine-protein kinase [Grimontia sp. NTOU-MAR1]|uniref:serine/threonine-protein kinase n=1 Tax=Grimontia sp. NTOU-MAR1 TaxID=3111011 RepID=UPI002DB775BD|nr:serine/threonine-protein kinase [Grimontia sp. NTOU-MAR1]WRV98565.1 serine/threonine-protein kinase [Grimontia sp. NTOU-MAR1]
MKIPSRYNIVGDEISGGMGDILYCCDSHLDRQVAIKFIKDAGEERRMFDEQLALMQLRSKHVVQLYDVLRYEQKIGLVLEYIEGKDLEPSECKGDMAKLIFTLWQISCGLADIHASGIIHRDIKPNNIRRSVDGVLKIFDFGLSRGTDAAKTRSIIGTIGYMAPELWNRTEAEFSSSVDVYAFGVTALALAGVPPQVSLFNQPPTPVGTDWLSSYIELEPELCLLLESCLSYEASDRPTMNEVESSLRKHLLKDRHKGLLVMGAEAKEISSSNRKAKLRFGSQVSGHSEIEIEYDGFRFFVSALSGTVSINNIGARQGLPMPQASVITLEAGQNRGFVTFDISNPEVVS